MKVLITGGAGSVGKFLVASLLEKGQTIRVLDKVTESISPLKSKSLEIVRGGVEDTQVVDSALQGMEAVIHLAWSFSDKPPETFDIDVKGHINLLEASLRHKVRHFIYTSSAVVYGKPQYIPIDEKHPCLVEEARKPLYAIAKWTTEKLSLAYQKEYNLPVTIFRFWWAFGEEIGGRHLREMVRTALEGKPLQVPDNAGGSFLYLDDFVGAVERALLNEKAFGETFNLSTLYLTWREVVELIVELVKTQAKVEVVPQEEWKGSSFLANVWNLDVSKAHRLLGWKPAYSEREAKDLLKKAIKECVRVVS